MTKQSVASLPVVLVDDESTVLLSSRMILGSAGIKDVLSDAIKEGGTTLRDFTSDGRPGYFQQSLRVYGRDGEPCIRCGTAILQRRQGQRATYYCKICQR